MNSNTRTVSANKASCKRQVARPQPTDSKSLPDVAVVNAPLTTEQKLIVRDNQTAKRLVDEIRAALPKLQSNDLRDLATVLRLLRTQRCGLLTPFETFVSDLLAISGHGNPSLDQVQDAFSDYRANFENYIQAARGALQRYPDLVKGGDE